MPEDSIKFSSVNALIVFGLAFAFLLIFADRNGFEGDDLNSVLPMLHLREALAGDLLIYRPDWQPLSYELGSAVYTLTGHVSVIFLLSPVFMAVGIALQYETVRALAFPTQLFIPLLFLFPEIFYTGLYYNSSALGFPFACAAVLFSVTHGTRWSAVAIGALLAIAALMRMDFVLIAPFVVIIRVWKRRQILDFVLAGLGAIVIFGLAVFAKVLDPQAVIDVYSVAREEIVARANEPGWDNHTKLLVATAIFSPIGWAVLVFGVAKTAITPRYWLPVLIGLLCLAPMIYAARNILTVKYMIPAFTVFPVIGAMLWLDVTMHAHQRWRLALSSVWIFATFFLLVAAIEPKKEAPFLQFAAQESRVVSTHDGPRSWGAYLWHTANVKRIWTDGPDDADALFETLLEPHDRPIIFIGDQGAFSSGALVWRHLQLKLVEQGFKGRLLAKDFIAFTLPSGAVAMTSTDTVLPQGYEHACLIDLQTTHIQTEVSQKLLACRQ